MPKEGKRAHGGQVGHQGNRLKRVAQPDPIQPYLPERCQGCGRFFRPDEAYQVIHSRQVFDVPEPTLEVTEQRLGQLACGGVWRRVAAWRIPRRGDRCGAVWCGRTGLGHPAVG